jgi:site-specific DNA recombinase
LTGRNRTVRVAIYARYSSELQDHRSIEDQIRLCRSHAERQGWTVAEICTDYALSGATLERPGLVSLLAIVKSRAVDAVLSESLDRISRDQEHVAHIYKRVIAAGAVLMSVQEGEISELHIGFKGTMAALYLKDLAAKVRRGAAGRAAAGRAPGGLSYGYRIVRRFTANGEPERGLREPDPDQARVVQRIYAEYIAGRSPAAIVGDLNREGIQAPRGEAWNVSTVVGARGRENGILSNPLYVGRVRYQRLQMIRDPDTGRRISRRRDVAEIVEGRDEALRIVTDEAWQAVQSMKRARGAWPLHQARRPKHMFSGLVACGCCGAQYIVKSNDWLACSARQNRRTCENDRRVRVGDLERRILGGLRSRLLSADVVATFVRTYHDERRRLAGTQATRRDHIGRRLPEIDRQIERLIVSIAEGVSAALIRDKLTSLEAERDRLRAEEAAIVADTRVVELHPNAAEIYRRQVDDLEAALAADPLARAEATQTLRRLVARVEVHRKEERGAYDLRVVGSLANLLSLATGVPVQGLDIVGSDGGI